MEARQRPDKMPRVLGALALATLGAEHNHLALLNGAPLSGTSISWASTALVSREGSVRVKAQMSGTGTPAQTVTAQLQRDASTNIGPVVVVEIDDGGHWFASAEWIDTVTPGSSHTWNFQAAAAGALTVANPQALIIVEDLAG